MTTRSKTLLAAVAGLLFSALLTLFSASTRAEGDAGKGADAGTDDCLKDAWPPSDPSAGAAIDGVPGVLFAGASFQKLRITCSSCAALNEAEPVRLKHGDDQLILARVESKDTSSAVLELRDLPASITSGNWDVVSELRTVDGGAAAADAGPTGIVLLTTKLSVVRDPLSVAGDAANGPLLDVHYDVNAGDRELDLLHNQRSVGGYAVVTPTKGAFKQFIQNVATITTSPELQQLARALSERQAARFPDLDPTPCKADASADDCAQETKRRCDELERKVSDYPDDSLKACEDAKLESCRAKLRVWRVRKVSWDDDTVLYEPNWWYADRPVRLDVLGPVSFATFHSQRAPFDVDVSLVDVEAEVAPSKEPKEVTVFSTRVRLANGARVESLPLPVARSMYVVCGAGAVLDEGFFQEAARGDHGPDVARNGTTQAVNDEDLTTGQCRLHYSSSLLLRGLQVANGPEGHDLLKYFGPQLVTISLAHGDAPDQTKTSRIDPSVDSDIYLPALPPGAKTDRLYTVTVRPDRALPPAVLYRGQTTPGDGVFTGELEFRASLRPRGPYGWKVVPIRVFATFPVNVTGVRFPAATSELRASSHPVWGQVSPVQAGVLVAVEPWDYNTGRNLWPIPTRFVTGMHLFDLSEGAFTPSWVTGLSVTLPIVNLQKGAAEDQLGTDAALGLFWEVDLREKQPFRYGHHALVTLGVNVLSLFGSK